MLSRLTRLAAVGLVLLPFALLAACEDPAGPGDDPMMQEQGMLQPDDQPGAVD